MSGTRERLIETGFELFSRHGFHAIGLDRIIDEVGVSKQTFYNHFESKDDLIIAVLRRRDQWEQETFGGMLRDIAGEDPRDQLYGLFDALHAWLNREDFRGCIFINAAAEFPSPHEPAHQAAAEHVRLSEAGLRELAEGAGAEDPAQVSAQLMVLMSGAVLWRHISGKTDAALVAKKAACEVLDRHLPPPKRRKTVRRQAVGV